MTIPNPMKFYWLLLLFEFSKLNPSHHHNKKKLLHFSDVWSKWAVFCFVFIFCAFSYLSVSATWAVHVCLIVNVFIYLCTFVFPLQMSRANQVLLLSQLLHFLQHDCLPQILLLLLLLLLLIIFFFFFFILSLLLYSLFVALCLHAN